MTIRSKTQIEKEIEETANIFVTSGKYKNSDLKKELQGFYKSYNVDRMDAGFISILIDRNILKALLTERNEIIKEVEKCHTRNDILELLTKLKGDGK